MRSTRLFWFVVMIGLGLAAGLLYGWVISPVEYVDTAPASLRADFKADYVLMIAEIYQSDGDREAAAQRLALLGDQPPEQILNDALLIARELEYGQLDLQRMTRLAQAFSVSSGGQP